MTWHCIENPKGSIRKLLELISEFSKVAGYKINTLLSLYTNKEKSEWEIKESIPFTTATKRIKYLGINLPKETKGLHTENYKTLMKQIKEHKQMERYLCSWVLVTKSCLTLWPNGLWPSGSFVHWILQARIPEWVDRKNQYCENDYTTKCNLQIQCYSYKITNGIFQRTKTKNFTTHMEIQKTPK